MAWGTPVTVVEVRTECGLITVALIPDADVTAAITESEFEIESNVLRGRYDLTDPSTDSTTKRACLDLVIAKLLGRIYGSEGWVEVSGENLRASGLFAYYAGRWQHYLEGVPKGTVNLTLTRIANAPEVYNEPLGTAERSQFDLDSKAEFGLDLVTDE